MGYKSLNADQETGERNKVWNFEEDNSEVFEGVYRSRKENVGQFKSNVYVCEHQLGEKFDIWGNSVLDSNFEKVKFGDKIKITFLGMKKSGGGRHFKNFLFEVWSDD